MSCTPAPLPCRQRSRTPAAVASDSGDHSGVASRIALTCIAILLWPAGALAGGDDAFAAARKLMVEEQISAPARGIKNERVLAAMYKVPRHEFVPEEQRSRAYSDRPLPIGHRQTISQPYIVAYMTEVLDLQPTDRVLEIGTGSGYQAAVLAELARQVYTIEIVEPLAKRAKTTLTRLGYDNLTLKLGDGYEGWPERAPFDAIIVTCAPDHVPPPLIEQLSEGGKMIIPVGEQGRPQHLYVMEKTNGSIERKAVLPVRFVPMTRKKE